MDVKSFVDEAFNRSKAELDELTTLNEEVQKMTDDGREPDEEEMERISFEMERNLSIIEERVCHFRNEFYKDIKDNKGRVDLMDGFETHLEEKLREYGLQGEEEESE